MTRPLFSVIIPTYNRPRILQRTLDCLEAQQCNFPFEVIVVDDYTENVLPDLGFGKGKRQNWKLIRNGANLGRAAARNVGIRAAKGEYILFLDDDIWAEPQLLQAHYDRQKEIGGGAVVGAVPVAKEVPDDLPNEYYRRWMQRLNEKMLAIKNNLSYNYFFTGNVSIKTSILKRIGLFDEAFGGYSSEDTEMGYRLIKSGFIMGYEPKAVGWHYNVETLDTILTKKIQGGLSAYILSQKHHELSKEISVAGILVPGNKKYQILLNRPVLLFARFICSVLQLTGLNNLLINLLDDIGNLYYAFGMKHAKKNMISRV